jgi:23S rRNA (cytidine1920-2'-O)/16S rRNA (cytidine1409-2'-O)-methyltransferase
LKKRLDVLLVEKQLEQSRERARSIIMAGLVYVNGQKDDKPGSMTDVEASLEVRGKTLQYVSRGGLKLEKALLKFGIDLQGKTAMDIGASTGGFTDCMFQNGAAKVYCVDVGYGQLAWKLRTDPRVVNMERVNIRYVTTEQVPDQLDFISIDVSFISLALVLPVAKQLLKPEGEIVALIKPQFEAGREKVGKKGVVRDPSVHREVIEKVIRLAQSMELSVKGIDFSPVKGPEGNLEYLLYLKKGEKRRDILFDIGDVVDKSYHCLKGSEDFEENCNHSK